MFFPFRTDISSNIVSQNIKKINKANRTMKKSKIGRSGEIEENQPKSLNFIPKSGILFLSMFTNRFR